MAKRSRSAPPTPPAVPRSVDPATGLSLLKRQIEKGNGLLENRPLQTAEHRAWINTTNDYLVKAFGSASPNINAVLHARSDFPLSFNMGAARYEQYEASQLTNQIKMLESCLEQLQTEIDLGRPRDRGPNAEVTETGSSTVVFLVHGHDSGKKETVARFLEKLDLDPLILHEKPNAGRTLIQKFTDYSNVRFAVVLLTADDLGRGRDEPDPPRPRARQNVIFELGFFLGKLGSPRVCALYEDGVEIPSDYQGVLFVPLDPQGKWRGDLVRELKAAGFDVDANRIFSAD